MGLRVKVQNETKNALKENIKDLKKILRVKSKGK